MIDLMIFTKDRACQLDLLLRSIEKNFKEITHIKILYKVTGQEYTDGYLKLLNKFYDEERYEWIEETNFRNDTINIINSFNNKYCLTLVDDEIVIRDYSIQPLLDIMDNSDVVHCASLRMGVNIGNYSYTSNLHCKKPELLEVSPGVFIWDWGKGDERTDWFYPSCINSHIYRTLFLKEQINKLNFSNANELEGFLNNERLSFPRAMICSSKSKTINIANNIVQTGSNRHSGKEVYSLRKLNGHYLSDKVILLEPFDNMENDQATFESEYTFGNSNQ